MDTRITGRNVEITDRFREYVDEKATKLEALAAKAIALEVKVSRHAEKSGGSAGDDRVELTLVGPGPAVRAESTAGDKYAAFDLACGKLLERVRRAKDRKKVHRGQHRPTSLREAAEADFAGTGVVPASAEALDAVRTGSVPVQQVEPEAETDEDWSPVVIREKVFSSTPMTLDDALYYMELVGHDFYLFIDSGTQRPSVVYRRKGWDYGVIGLDPDAEDQQEAVTAARAGVTG